MIVYVAKMGFGWLLVSVDSGNLVNQFVLLPWKSHDPDPFVCMSSSQAFMETKHFSWAAIFVLAPGPCVHDLHSINFT